MRLFAEENKVGTIETLLTAPVKTIHVLLAKYFSALLFYIILWIPSVVNFILLWLSSKRIVKLLDHLVAHTPLFYYWVSSIYQSAA